MSISIAPELDHALRRAAEADGEPISTWVAEAIQARLAKRDEDLDIEQQLRELHEWFGPIPPDVAHEVDEEMLRLGLMTRPAERHG